MKSVRGMTQVIEKQSTKQHGNCTRCQKKTQAIL
jgi:hypothetical protein